LSRNGLSNHHRPRRPRPPLAGTVDRHLLYEASVQSVDADLDFFKRLSLQRRGKPLRRMTEDFCGTAVLACTFVKQHPEHRAWGVDLDADTLKWCRHHNFPVLGKDAKRLVLLHGDVLHTPRPRVDLVTALNFSYWVFETRDLLRQYFRKVRASLVPDGFFVLDAFGGSEAMGTLEEKRRIPASKAFDGRRVPAFTYVWNQQIFNSIDHHMVCHIGFRFRDGSRRPRAFSYDWRMWTLPELQELLLEAGYASVEVFMEGWDHRNSEPDGIFRRRKTFENQEGWIGYVVAYR
jgi:SAM-dependent methyltransferase